MDFLAVFYSVWRSFLSVSFNVRVEWDGAFVLLKVNQVPWSLALRDAVLFAVLLSDSEGPFPAPALVVPGVLLAAFRSNLWGRRGRLLDVGIRWKPKDGSPGVVVKCTNLVAARLCQAIKAGSVRFFGS